MFDKIFKICIILILILLWIIYHLLYKQWEVVLLNISNTNSKIYDINEKLNKWFNCNN